MRTWAFVSQKGGSGKSTLCTNLSVVAEQAGETCCIVDVDPQANALLWHERRGTNQPMVIEATYDKLADVVAAAGTIGVTLVLIDTPGKIDAGALAAIKLANTIVCPTLGDLFSLGSIRDTVRLLETAEKLSSAVGVINNVDQGGAKQTIAEATAVLDSFIVRVAPVHIMHRGPLSAPSSAARASPKPCPRAQPQRRSKTCGSF